jgi:hypothetical protein
MSDFMNKDDMFIEPVTRQYGSHMVMTNVQKPRRTRYVNIDTKFKDEYNYHEISNCNISLPERITEVRTMTVTNIEIPMTFYNISVNFGNNNFRIINPDLTQVIIIIPDGNYTPTTIISAINTALTATLTPSTLTFSTIMNTTQITSTAPLTIDFDVDSNGGNDKYNLKTKLGWLLGFRKSSYEFATSTIIDSINMIDIYGPRYLYLAIDEFNKSNQNTFLSPMQTSIINKNIIARISLDTHVHPFGTVLPANRYNGLLVSDTRSYTGKIDLHKLNVQLLNEYGKPMVLNGMDFAFCLEIINE